MLYLILAIICSGSVTLTLRFGENHCENKRAVVMFNYVTAIASTTFGKTALRSLRPEL